MLLYNKENSPSWEGFSTSCSNRSCLHVPELSWAGARWINARKWKTYETPWRKFDLASVKIFNGAVEVNERWQIQSRATFHYLRAEHNTSRSEEYGVRCTFFFFLHSLAKCSSFWQTKWNEHSRKVRSVRGPVHQTVDAVKHRN